MLCYSEGSDRGRIRIRNIVVCQQCTGVNERMKAFFERCAHEGHPVKTIGKSGDVWGNIPTVPLSTRRTEMRIKWSYLAGTAGTVVAILGLVWAIYSYYGQQAHEREMARKAIEAQEAGKSDVTIELKAPDIDVDGTVEAIGEGAAAVKARAGEIIGNTSESVGETATNLKEKAGKKWDAVKEYWRGKREAERDPFVPDVDAPPADHPESK